MLRLAFRSNFLRVVILTTCALWISQVSAHSSGGQRRLSPEDIDLLVEPIALYPDMLLKAILPASTFPDQILYAGVMIRSKADAAQIKEQSWDESVKIVATYPGVLKMMFDELAWTQELGIAYLNQHQDVLITLQRKRAKAKELGNLESNAHQTVTTKSGPNGENVIVVQPTNPDAVHVPQLSDAAYTNPNEPIVQVPLDSFGLGVAVGVAIAEADDEEDDYYDSGYWSTPVSWYDDDDYDNWMDYRYERWEDFNDRRNDRVEHHQGARTDRREFRQNAIESGEFSGNGERASQRHEQAAASRNDATAGDGKLHQGLFDDTDRPGNDARAGERREQIAARTSNLQERNPDAAADAQARRENLDAQSRANAPTRSVFDSSSTSRGWGGSDAWRTASPSQLPAPRHNRSDSGGGAFADYGSDRRASTLSSRGAISRGGGGGGRR